MLKRTDINDCFIDPLDDEYSTDLLTDDAIQEHEMSKDIFYCHNIVGTEDGFELCVCNIKDEYNKQVVFMLDRNPDDEVVGYVIVEDPDIIRRLIAFLNESVELLEGTTQGDADSSSTYLTSQQVEDADIKSDTPIKTLNGDIYSALAAKYGHRIVTPTIWLRDEHDPISDYYVYFEINLAELLVAVYVFLSDKGMAADRHIIIHFERDDGQFAMIEYYDENPTMDEIIQVIEESRIDTSIEDDASDDVDVVNSPQTKTDSEDGNLQPTSGNFIVTCDEDDEEVITPDFESESDGEVVSYPFITEDEMAADMESGLNASDVLFTGGNMVTNGMMFNSVSEHLSRQNNALAALRECLQSIQDGDIQEMHKLVKENLTITGAIKKHKLSELEFSERAEGGGTLSSASIPAMIGSMSLMMFDCHRLLGDIFCQNLPAIKHGLVKVNNIQKDQKIE